MCIYIYVYIVDDRDLVCMQGLYRVATTGLLGCNKTCGQNSLGESTGMIVHLKYMIFWVY